MTQDDYKLWTGRTTNFAEADWERIVANAAGRLASFLCLDVLPMGLYIPYKQYFFQYVALDCIA